jgi:hypothetical protein
MSGYTKCGLSIQWNYHSVTKSNEALIYATMGMTLKICSMKEARLKRFHAI